MSESAQSLWPEKIGITSTVPGPVKILREQGIALNELTAKALYGEVLRSSIPSRNTVTYDFYIGVSDKPYRHKLLSIELGLLSDYPVTIYNHEANTTGQASEESAFKREIQSIFSADMTQDLLSRLLGFARD